MLVTVSGMTASFVMVLSGTIVNVAVPDVMGAMASVKIGAAGDILQRRDDNLPIVERLGGCGLGQRYGYTLTLIIFTVGSVIAGLADSLACSSRTVMQGMATASSAYHGDGVPGLPGERRGFAMGIYSMGLVLAVAMPVGGLALEVLSWRYIFWLPAPVAVLHCLRSDFLPSVRKPGGQPSIAAIS